MSEQEHLRVIGHNSPLDFFHGRGAELRIEERYVVTVID